MNIQEILADGRSASEVIADLKKKSIRVRSWAELQKEYDPTMHPVNDRVLYPDKQKSKQPTEKVTRITRGWQKLAVKRMSGLAFGIPVQRKYITNTDEEAAVAQIMESIFKKNRIDSVNRDRAKQLYASCEFATIWYTQEMPTMYAGEVSPLKLRCKTFSPMNNAQLYPLFDEYDDMIAMSVEYSRVENNITTTYFETYTDSMHIRWATEGGSLTEEYREPIMLGKIAAVYAHRADPIWEAESENVYEAEWALSRNGNYLRKNARPNWVVFSDDNVSRKKDVMKDNDGVAFIQYPANAKAGYQTWQQAIDSLKFHVDTIKENFFMQLQLPDLSYENMKSGQLSGEARKMMFIDAQQKVLDESGMWLEAFDREINVVRAFMKFMYPQYAAAIESLQVECIMTPFSIDDESEDIANLTNATGGKAIMSQRTAISLLGKVSDVEEELAQINDESVMDVFQEPTE